MVTPGARGAIRLLAIAFASVAVLVFLQTLVLQALSYDSASFPTFVTIFRVAFFGADVVGFVGLVRLVRRHVPTRPFTVSALALGIFSVASGAFGTIAHVMGPPSRSRRLLESFAATMSAAEPAIAIGTTLLVAFALGAMLRAKSTADAKPAARAALPLWAVFVATTTIWLLVTLVRSSSREAQTMTIAWLVWGLEIGKWLAVASYAFVVFRALGGSANDGDSPKDGPYREGDAAPAKTGAEPEEPAPLAPPDPATIEPLRRAASGLSLYSMAFAIRIGAAIVLTLVTMVGVRSGDMWFVYLLLPTAGVVTASMMGVGLGRQRVLPSFRAGGRLTTAIVFMWITAASDAFAVVGILLAAMSGSSWSARRKAEQMFVMSYPTSALWVGVAILLVASALARAGEAFGREALTRRARWAQSLAVLVFALGLALMFSIAAINGHDYDQKNGGALVCGALSIAAFAALIAFVILHILSQAEASRMIRARLGLAR